MSDALNMSVPAEGVRMSFTSVGVFPVCWGVWLIGSGVKSKGCAAACTFVPLLAVHTMMRRTRVAVT